jgi:chorismate mutase
MNVRGIRGAIQAESNSEKAIFEATQQLLTALLSQNSLDRSTIASVFLTATSDLNAAFPAHAVRELGGWDLVPLLCARELEVPGAMPRVIRILLHVNTAQTQPQIQHVYLGNTAQLRPDLAQKS